MSGFARGDYDILVSTTVVEVGVDVPNASVMLVEHAERFGLSQLHQLRGRVGRGQWESHCILLYQSPWTDYARERLKAMSSTTDGFAIAEEEEQGQGRQPVDGRLGGQWFQCRLAFHKTKLPVVVAITA